MHVQIAVQLCPFISTRNVRHPFLQPIFFDPFMNIVGATMIKYVNNFANGLTNFPTYDLVIQVVLFDADNLYTRHISYARLQVGLSVTAVWLAFTFGFYHYFWEVIFLTNKINYYVVYFTYQLLYRMALLLTLDLSGATTRSRTLSGIQVNYLGQVVLDTDILEHEG